MTLNRPSKSGSSKPATDPAGVHDGGRGEPCAKDSPRNSEEPVGSGVNVADHAALCDVVTVRDELSRYYRDERGHVHLLL
jgi:hypothetical protein